MGTGSELFLQGLSSAALIQDSGDQLLAEDVWLSRAGWRAGRVAEARLSPAAHPHPVEPGSWVPAQISKRVRSSPGTTTWSCVLSANEEGVPGAKENNRNPMCQLPKVGVPSLSRCQC